jgi:Holliday junction resolvase RusA-like endonuclease
VYTLVLPFLPPTANHAQKNRLQGGFIRRYNTPAYNAFKAKVELALRDTKFDGLQEFLAVPHNVSIEIHSPRVLTRKGKVSKTFGDVDNFVKTLNDAVYKPLGADDALIMKLTVGKHDADDEFCSMVWWEGN